MTRFADPSATRTVDLGTCECPGTPHPNDFIEIRSSLAPGECNAVFGITRLEPRKQAAVLVDFLVRWNLNGADGEPMPLDADSLFLLDAPSQQALGEALGEVAVESATLPNRFGAPSPASPRGSASRTRTSTRKRGT